MKRKFLPLFALIGVITLFGCDESADPAISEVMSEAERTQQVLDRLEKNAGISYDMFGILGKRLTADSLQVLRKNSASKESFIDNVTSQTDDYFNEVVEGSIAEFDINTIPTPFSGEAEITLKGLASTETAGVAPVDVVAEYSNLLLKTISDQAADGHKDWIVIHSIDLPGETASDSKPSESLSLNFTKMEMLATIPHQIILDLDLTDDQVLTEVNKVVNAYEIPPVAIGLLLPAVQKVRAADTPDDQPFEDAMNAWLDGPIKQAIGGGLDRDIIRRIQASVYLAALHTIILDGYEGTNQDAASLSILHARYRAALIMGTKELWVE